MSTTKRKVKHFLSKIQPSLLHGKGTCEVKDVNKLKDYLKSVSELDMRYVEMVLTGGKASRKGLLDVVGFSSDKGKRMHPVSVLCLDFLISLTCHSHFIHQPLFRQCLQQLDLRVRDFTAFHLELHVLHQTSEEGLFHIFQLVELLLELRPELEAATLFNQDQSALRLLEQWRAAVTEKTEPLDDSDDVETWSDVELEEDFEEEELKEEEREMQRLLKELMPEIESSSLPFEDDADSGPTDPLQIPHARRKASSLASLGWNKRRSRGMSKRVALDLGQSIQSNRINVASPAFDPHTFLKTVHVETSAEQLKRGLKTLQRSETNRLDQLQQLVRGHFDQFVTAKDTINAIHTRLELEKEQQGTARLERALVKVRETAQQLYRPLLQQKHRADKIRQALRVVQKFSYLFEFPSAFQRNLKEQKFDEIVRDYHRLKAVEYDTHNPFLRKVMGEIQRIVSAIRRQLYIQLQDTSLDVEQQLRIITQLVELDCITHPLWYFVAHHQARICSMLDVEQGHHCHRLTEGRWRAPLPTYAQLRAPQAATVPSSPSRKMAPPLSKSVPGPSTSLHGLTSHVGVTSSPPLSSAASSVANTPRTMGPGSPRPAVAGGSSAASAAHSMAVPSPAVFAFSRSNSDVTNDSQGSLAGLTPPMGPSPVSPSRRGSASPLVGAGPKASRFVPPKLKSSTSMFDLRSRNSASPMLGALSARGARSSTGKPPPPSAPHPDDDTLGQRHARQSSDPVRPSPPPHSLGPPRIGNMTTNNASIAVSMATLNAVSSVSGSGSRKDSEDDVGPRNPAGQGQLKLSLAPEDSAAMEDAVTLSARQRDNSTLDSAERRLALQGVGHSRRSSTISMVSQGNPVFDEAEVHAEEMGNQTFVELPSDEKVSVSWLGRIASTHTLITRLCDVMERNVPPLYRLSSGHHKPQMRRKLRRRWRIGKHSHAEDTLRPLFDALINKFCVYVRRAIFPEHLPQHNSTLRRSSSASVGVGLWQDFVTDPNVYQACRSGKRGNTHGRSSRRRVQPKVSQLQLDDYLRVLQCCQSLEALSSKNELLSGLSEDISKFYIATLFKVALWDVSCLRDDENWLIVGHDQPCVTHLPSKFRDIMLKTLRRIHKLPVVTEHASYPKWLVEAVSAPFLECLRVLGDVYHLLAFSSSSSFTAGLSDAEAALWAAPEVQDRRILACYGNVIHSLDLLFPELWSRFIRLVPGFAQPVLKLEYQASVHEPLVILEDHLLHQYVRHKTSALNMCLQNGLVLSGVDFAKCAEWRDVRSYVMEALLTLVSIHDEVFSMQPVHVVQFLQQIVTNMFSSFRVYLDEIDVVGANGAVQLSAELEFLAFAVGKYLTDQSQGTVDDLQDVLEDTFTDCSEQEIERRFARKDKLVLRAKQRSAALWACFSVLPESAEAD